MDLPVDRERAFRGGRPRELGGSFAAELARQLPSSPQAARIAVPIAAGSSGSASRAAPPAVSGIALRSDVTTGHAHAMASRMGSPKVSLNDG